MHKMRTEESEERRRAGKLEGNNGHEEGENVGMKKGTEDAKRPRGAGTAYYTSN